MMKRKRIVVLGGGLSGLAAAEILAKKHDVTVLESAPFIGGLAATFEQDGKRIPMYYHHIIRSNSCTQDYLKRFGKVKELEWQRIKVAIGVEGKLCHINNPFRLLGWEYLNVYEKFRFGLFGLYTLFLMNPERIQTGMDAESWLNRHAGKAVTRKIFYHLYSRNKFNVPLSRISAKQFAYRLHEKEVYDLFSFPKESYQGMIDGLEESLLLNGGKVKKRAKISAIDLKKKYVVESGRKVKYDALISSIPFEVLIRLSSGLPPAFRKQIAKVKWCPGVGLCFATEDWLEKGTYWTNLFDERVHVVMQHSVLCDVYGYKVNWCLRYGGSEEDLGLSDAEIKKEYLAVIKKYYPHAKFKWVKVMRTRYAEPIYDIDYHKYMPDYKTPVPGLYFTGIQLTYPKIRNMNVALESGVKAADAVLKEIDQKERH